jgi:hypothetical protein
MTSQMEKECNDKNKEQLLTRTMDSHTHWDPLFSAKNSSIQEITI